MCIAIVQPANQRLTEAEAKASWDSNSHGAGVAYIDSGKIKLEKVLDNFQQFWQMYNRICDEFGSKKMLVHFRIKTHGAQTLDNTHPFLIDDRHALIHNGIITAITSKTSNERSDTRAFVEEVLMKLPEGWFDNAAIPDLLASYIGTGSKVAILRADETVLYLNGSLGGAHIGRDGFWFSNNSYKPVVRTNYYDYGDRNYGNLFSFGTVKGTVNGKNYEFNKSTRGITVKYDGFLLTTYLKLPSQIMDFADKNMDVLFDLDIKLDGELSEIITNYEDWKTCLV